MTEETDFYPLPVCNVFSLHCCGHDSRSRVLVTTKTGFLYQFNINLDNENNTARLNCANSVSLISYLTFVDNDEFQLATADLYQSNNADKCWLSVAFVLCNTTMTHVKSVWALFTISSDSGVNLGTVRRSSYK